MLRRNYIAESIGAMTCNLYCKYRKLDKPLGFGLAQDENDLGMVLLWW